MSIDEAIADVEAMLANLDAELTSISEEVSINAKSLIIRRIQSQGLAGKHYSTNKIPAYLFLLDESRLDTAAAINFVKQKEESKNEEDREITWADVRQAHGNQIGYVDLTYTGRMFMNIGVIKTDKANGIYTTTLGGLDAETRQKLSWNTIRYGTFFTLNDDEKKLIKSLADTRLKALRTKYLVK